MGTRAAIAEPHGDGWRGRYHHWDGYPTGLGSTLWELFHGHFAGDVEAMRQRLITDEPVGWSTINGADFSLPACSPDDETDGAHGPISYSVRGETSDSPDGDWVESDGDDGGTEWAYVLGDRSLFVFERRFGAPSEDEGHGTGMFGLGASDTAAGGYWVPRAELAWTGEDPDWGRVECGENFEHCGHMAYAHFPEAEGSDLSTDQWLGREPLRIGSVRQFEVGGETRTHTGRRLIGGDNYRVQVIDFDGGSAAVLVQEGGEFRIPDGVVPVAPLRADGTPCPITFGDE